MSSSSREPTDWFSGAMKRRTRRRYAFNSAFKWTGIVMIGFAFFMLGWLVQSIVLDAYPGFQQTQVKMSFTTDRDRMFRGLPENYANAVPSAVRKRLVDQRITDEGLAGVDADAATKKIAADVATVMDAIRSELVAYGEAGVQVLVPEKFPALDLAAIVPAGTDEDVVAAFEEEVPAVLDVQIQASIDRYDYGATVRESIMGMFPEVGGRRDVRSLTGLISNGARSKIRDALTEDRTQIGETITIWVPTSDDVHTLMTGSMSRDVPESDRRLKDQEIAWVDTLIGQDIVRTVLSKDFFTSGDSREPELAGIWGATVGSFFTLLVTLAVAFPVGVLAAVYLEEFAVKGRMSDLIEVNINNLAAVPSIVFGLLGLAIYLNVFHLPRSAPIVGGLTLALMTLPTIIIAARAALKAVPPSIRDAALGLGASRVQVTFHHVLPLAMPGILTGTIIGMAQALGETAPLLMIGMVAFVADIPGGIFDPSTVLPVQIFIWADSPERAFEEKTAAAIVVLLTFLVLMNALAVVLRKRFERKW